MKRNRQLILTIQALLFFMVMAITTNVSAQKIKGTIRGKVTEGASQAIDDASISLKNTRYGTITNEDGIFSLKAPAGGYTVVVSVVGYQQQEIPVNVKAGQTTDLHDIVLTPATGNLHEVRINDRKANIYSTKRSNDVAKLPLDNLENPQVYSTIGSNLLTEQQIFSVDDALKNVPGLQTMWNATGRSGDGGGYFNSRGFILQSTLRDGMAGLVTNTNDAVNIDKIEVLKGPSATLFGSTLTSFGGVINRITKKPYDTVGGAVSYTAGSYGLQRLTADINAPLDKAKKLLFRLNTAVDHEGSFTYNGFSQSAVIDPSLVYNVNYKLSISFDAELNYSKSSEKPIFFFSGNVAALGTNRADGLDLDYRQSYANDNLDQNSRNNNYYGRVTYKISDQWTSQTNFSATNSYSNGFGPYYYLIAKDTISRNDQSTKNSTASDLEIQQNFNGDFKIGNMRNRFVGGLDYFHQNSNQLFLDASFDKVTTTLGKNAYGNFNYPNLQAVYNNPANVFNYNFAFKTDVYSTYVADELNITDQLLALVSLRADHYDNKGGNTAGLPTPAFTQNTLSPKFGLVYQVVKKQVSLFANYQNGFINPGGYAAHDDATNTTITKIAKVQNAEQIEGGVKLDLFDGKLSSTLSYYDIKLTNVLRVNPLYAAEYPTPQLQDGTQVSKGFEAEVIANPFQGFNLIGGFAYNDSYYTKAAADVMGFRPATAGSPYTANFYASYRLPKTAINGLGFGFGGNYASDNKIVNDVAQGTFILPAYTVYNASAFFERSKYRVNFAVNNLTDKHYWTGYSTLNPQMLRQLILSLTYKF